MTRLTFTLSPLGGPSALLTLPQPQTAQDLLELEQAVAGSLAHLGRELFGAGAENAHKLGPHWPNAGDIEYASWLPDPGAIEMASWTAHLRSAAH